jgi:hypothetical protein
VELATYFEAQKLNEISLEFRESWEFRRKFVATLVVKAFFANGPDDGACSSTSLAYFMPRQQKLVPP